MRRLTKAWLEFARDDLGVAEEILDREDLTHMAAFHCQQSVEKSFKAVLEEHEQIVPRIHEPDHASRSVEQYFELELESALLNQPNELYLVARYPSDLGLLPGGETSAESGPANVL